MELTVLLPLLSEIMKHPGSFVEKLILISFAAIVFGVVTWVVGNKHVKDINAKLDQVTSALNQIGHRLDTGEKVHVNHEQRISRLEKLTPRTQ